MKITALEPQKMSKNRFNLFVDTEFVAGVDAGTIAEMGLYAGKEVSKNELLSLGDEESYSRCLDKAFLLLSIRMQTEHELWEKLGKKFSKQVIARTIARLKTLGYVDDRIFATQWVETRSISRGPSLLRMELIKKGIRKEIIDEVLQLLDKEKQIISAKSLVASKDKPNLSSEERYKKLGGLLSRRGFSYEVVKEALKNVE